MGLFAQSPDYMSYQAVLRDGSDQLLVNQGVGVQVSILQGSVSGSFVYTETHALQSNTNGLLTFEIGSGATGDDFSSIDWSAGPYFIKTEIDPTTAGGSCYSITSVSQLLSVPFAYHANTADSVIGGFSENDPVFTSSEASNITSSDITNLGNLSGVNTGDQDLSTLSTKTALSGSISQLRSEIQSVQQYSVGDFAQGGIVFWVDETGQHGLVCAKEDQSDSTRWYAGTTCDTHAKGTGPYSGEMNTMLIIATQSAIGDDGDTYAARICNELEITEGGITYGDWYLPSRGEAVLMQQNRAVINATAMANGGTAFEPLAYYWSSSEYSSTTVFILVLSSTNMYTSLKTTTSLSVRAIRAS